MRAWMVSLILVSGCVGEAYIAGGLDTDPDGATDSASGDSGTVGDSGKPGDSGAGDTGSGDTGSGDTGAGDSGSGDSGSGDSGSGDSGSGDTGVGDSGAGDTGVGDSGPPACTATHTVVRPLKNAVNVPVDVEFEVTFGQPEQNTATASLSEVVSGRSVALAPVQWSNGGRTLRTRATSPLKPNLEYKFAGSYSCGGRWALAFTTASPSDPPVVPDDIRDRTYAVDIGSGRVAQPAALANLLQGQLQGTGRDLMLKVTRVQGAVLDILVGSGEITRTSWTQPRCEETTAVQNLDLRANPTFRGNVDELVLDVGGVTAVLQDVDLTGRFINGGDDLDRVGFAGDLDLRAVASVFGSTASQLCQTLPALSGGAVACANCPDGTGRFCIPLSVQDMEGIDADPFALQPRTAQQIANDRQCP